MDQELEEYLRLIDISVKNHPQKQISPIKKQFKQ